MMHSELHGTHNNGNREGEGMTLEDLYQLLKRVPLKARENYVMIVDKDCMSHDVIGLQFAQSDQAEKWEFKVYLKVSD